jgi:hypothetical protein
VVAEIQSGSGWFIGRIIIPNYELMGVEVVKLYIEPNGHFHTIQTFKKHLNLQN